MTIPSSELVSVTPSVLAAGGAGVASIGLMLTENTRVPIGTVQNFPNAAAVQTYFGPGNEANQAAVYFAGFEGAQQTPSSLLMAQYPAAGAAAYLRGGNISGLSLAQLQAIDGTLLVVVDGYSRNGGTVSLSSAASPTAAATTIATALNGSLSTEASFTGVIAPETFSVTGSIAGNVLTVTNVASGTIVNGAAISGTGVAANTSIVSQLSGTTGGIGTYAVSGAGQNATSTSIAGTYGQLTVTSPTGSPLAVGQTVMGAGVTTATIITQFGTGLGEAGTYFVNLTQTVSSESMTTQPTPVSVTYDSVSGAFVITSGVVGTASSVAFATGTAAAPLLLTQATGAVLSQGAAPAIPSTFMNALLQVNQNWVAFSTLFDPDAANGSVQRQAFAAWKNTALGGNRFCYVCWDTDITPTESVPATQSLGYILDNNGDSGTCLVWEPSDQMLASFVLGAIASVDFNQPDGRVDFAYKAQAGLTAGVSDPTTAQNLGGNPQTPGSFGNGYNFYGAYATAGQNNTWFQRNFVTGPFDWLDSYINQIVLNSELQVDLLTLFANARSIPFTAAGASLITAALQPTITQFLDFGAFGPGTLTASQQQQIAQATGSNTAANTIATQGWYLQIVPASTAVQSSRGPWQVNFYYLDNGCVQSIALSSVAVQG